MDNSFTSPSCVTVGFGRTMKRSTKVATTRFLPMWAAIGFVVDA